MVIGVRCPIPPPALCERNSAAEPACRTVRPGIQFVLTDHRYLSLDYDLQRVDHAGNKAAPRVDCTLPRDIHSA
jgi:hypothetical protein